MAWSGCRGSTGPARTGAGKGASSRIHSPLYLADIGNAGPQGQSAPSCLVFKPSGIIEMDKHTGPAETCLLPPANAIRHPKRILTAK
jgi:hypothetical protein